MISTTMIKIGGLIMMISAAIGVIFLQYMLAHIGMIIPFRGEYKETEALLKHFHIYEESSIDTSSAPVLSYYNMYRGETVVKIFMNSGIYSPSDKTVYKSKSNVAQIGEKIKIQYTKNFERVIDERFVSPNKYKLSRYLTPVIISFVCSAIGGISLIVGIVLG